MKTKPKGRRASDSEPEADKVEQTESWKNRLFNTYSANDHKVTLNRIEPREYLGVKSSGWLADVGPDVDEQFICDNFGGGRFVLNLIDLKSGYIVATCGLEISGFPKISSAASPTATPADQPAGAPVTMLDVAGQPVPFTGNIEQFGQILFLMRAAEGMFPKPVDVNAALLELVLKKEERPDPLDTLRTLKEASEMFQSGAGSTATGANMIDLINNAVSQVGTYLAMTTPKVRRMAGPVKPAPSLAGPGKGPGDSSGNGSGDSPGNAPGEQPKNLPEDDEPIADQGEDMTQKQVLLTVASTIAACWKLDPPKDAAGTVRTIDVILQESNPAARKYLLDSYSETITDICETQLAEEWVIEGSTVGDRKAFLVWIKEVFAEYIRPDREVMILD